MLAASLLCRFFLLTFPETNRPNFVCFWSAGCFPYSPKRVYRETVQVAEAAGTRGERTRARRGGAGHNIPQANSEQVQAGPYKQGDAQVTVLARGRSTGTQQNHCHSTLDYILFLINYFVFVHTLLFWIGKNIYGLIHVQQYDVHRFIQERTVVLT